MWQMIWEFLRTGGVVMVPLTGIGILIFACGLYQAWRLGLRDESAVALTPQDASPTTSCRPASWAQKALGLARRRTGLAGVSLLESIELCLARLEDCLTRRIATLKFLAQVSTLLGFLGTVTGMVRVFHTVSARGIVTPSELAGGMYEALFTTVYGLTLAIIAWGFVHWIETLARRQLRRLELLIIAELDTDETGGKAS
jgi:biopolymer transport protein ExbB